jgi:CubicO group peptidase (beta-lactamase class C family)
MKIAAPSIACLLAALASCALPAPLKAADPMSREIDGILRAAHEKGEFNGVALVAERGKVIHVAAYGTVGAAAGEFLTADHRFNIGSISKEFSAVAIMQLRERGLLSIDDPIARFLPDLPDWGATVTVRHLLDYTSGVPDMSWRTIKNDADAYADVRGFSSLQFEPGTRYAYTYNNVMLRQFIVEKIIGATFNDYVRQHIFKPCRMKTALLNAGPAVPLLARAFNAERKEDSTDMPVTGVAYTTARDLLAWSQCLHGGRLIERESLQLLGRGFEPANGALGLTTWAGDRLVAHAHDGQSRNFEALMRVDLAANSTVIMLSNSKRQNLQELADAVAARKQHRAVK